MPKCSRNIRTKDKEIETMTYFGIYMIVQDSINYLAVLDNDSK